MLTLELTHLLLRENRGLLNTSVASTKVFRDLSQMPTMMETGTIHSTRSDQEEGLKYVKLGKTLDVEHIKRLDR